MKTIPSVTSAVTGPRFAFAALTTGLCLLLLADELADMAVGELKGALAAVSFPQWVAGAMATALSFAAIGQYDTLFHRWLRTGVSDKRAAVSGASAIALAQTAGFGLATGTLARWRLLPELSARDALKLTCAVSASFMAALGLIAGAVFLIAPGSGAAPWTIAPLTIVVIAGLCLLSLLAPSFLPFALPPMRLMASLLLVTLLDVVFAAAALYVLLPADAAVTFGPVLAAYVLALGAGLLSGTPGGFGPFELCLIVLLPAVPEPDLIAAILAFRLVYYAIPAILGIIAAASVRGRPAPPPTPHANHIASAEARGLLSEPDHRLIQSGPRLLHVAETSQVLAAIGDPATGGTHDTDTVQRLTLAAQRQHLSPALYKVRGRSAVPARRSGWSVLAISEEAWLDPQRFSEEGPTHRQLRRKLRHASKAGVTVGTATNLPLENMQEVAKDWAKRHGGERGFSMGRFDPDTLADQHVILAHLDNRLVAFATFHVAPSEWVLNLMRSTGDAPDGTMHTLVTAALNTARHAGITRFSLASMPLAAPPPILRKAQKMDGLRQFKLCFAPRIEKLYMAAPNRALLVLAGIDILLRIRFPRPKQPWSLRAALQKMQSGLHISSVVPGALRSHLQSNDETPV